jgi:hypothetical protein
LCLDRYFGRSADAGRRLLLRPRAGGDQLDGAGDRGHHLQSGVGSILPSSRSSCPASALPAAAGGGADRKRFDEVLADYGEVLDISREDLEMLYLELVSRADEKRKRQAVDP